MKNFAIISILVALVFCSCSKSESEVSPKPTPTPSPRLSQVRYAVQHIINKYDYSNVLQSSDTSIYDYVSQHWIWNNDILASIEYFDTTGLLYVNDYVFKEGRVQSYSQRGSNSVTYYRYSNARLDSIITYNGNSLASYAAFSYTSNSDTYPASAFFARGGQTPSVYHLSWNNDNMISYNWNYDANTSITECYDFDNHFNPFYHVESSLNVVNLSKHNRTTCDYTFASQYGNTNKYTVYNYVYDGVKPVSMSYSDTSKIGRTTNIYHYSYLYTYLPE